MDLRLFWSELDSRGRLVESDWIGAPNTLPSMATRRGRSRKENKKSVKRLAEQSVPHACWGAPVYPRNNSMAP